MSRRGQGPQITCPDCTRTVRVGPNNERIHPHNRPDTNTQCASSGQRIDLYGTDPIPTGGEQ